MPHDTVQARPALRWWGTIFATRSAPQLSPSPHHHPGTGCPQYTSCLFNSEGRLARLAASITSTPITIRAIPITALPHAPYEPILSLILSTHDCIAHAPATEASVMRRAGPCQSQHSCRPVPTSRLPMVLVRGMSGLATPQNRHGGHCPWRSRPTCRDFDITLMRRAR